MKKNLLIAFSGMDGSGKTTVAKKLESYMNKKGYNVFFKHAHGYAISKNSFSVDEKSIKRFRWLLFLLSPFMLLDSYFTYYFKYKPQLKHNTVICDRYFYDKVARMLYYNIINKFVARIYLSLLPQPDHLFFLNVSSHNAKLRKNERLKKLLLAHEDDAKLRSNLNNFYNGITNDMMVLACAIRNIYAHGEFTAGGAGLVVAADCKDMRSIADEVLDYCDELFRDCTNKL